MAPAAFPRRLLFDCLPRSRQRQLREIAHAGRSSAIGSGVRVRRRRVLRRLFSVRGAEQPRVAPRRRPDLDRADHGHLGPRLGRHGVHRHVRTALGLTHRHRVLRAALPARNRRGRLLPRRAAVPELLVPVASAEPGRGLAARGAAVVVRGRRADLGRDHAKLRRRPWPIRLAVAVLARGRTGHRARDRRGVLSDERHRRLGVAHGR